MRRGTRRGFSMLELVVVVGMLAFAIGPMVLSSRSSIGKTEYDMKRAMAVNLATRMAERFAAVDYYTLVETIDASFDPDADPLLSPETYPDFLKARLGEYSKQVTFRELVTDRVGIVEVAVRWYPRKGMPQATLKASKVIVNPYPPMGSEAGPLPPVTPG